MSQDQQNGSNQPDSQSGKKLENGKLAIAENGKPLTGPEALSALMDGELSTFEYRRLIQDMKQNPEWQGHWERYHLVRDSLRAEPSSRPMPASKHASGLRLSDRIAAAIEDEQLPQVRDQEPLLQAVPSRWWRAPARLAVAAAVALAVFAGMQSLLVMDSQPTVETLTANSEQQTGTQLVAESGSTVVDADAQQRLNEYIRSVSIPSRATEQSAPFNVLRESPLLRPVSDRELLPLDELGNVRSPAQERAANTATTEPLRDSADTVSNID